MPPEIAKYLRDMLDAARTIEEEVRGLTEGQFVQNRLVRDAVSWNYCVIGEALSQLLKIDEPTGRQITDSWKIVGLRNQLIHGYGTIDHNVTWRIVSTKLPILRQDLERLLAS